ncbi:MAG TPA: AarF/UbiB family protein [Hyphomicrobiaceae bacterium]|nr:AarF/UbiB family protein [Hyphomicrobiaceae bacterium]
MGIGASSDQELAKPRPETVVAIMRELGPVAVKFGQILAMRSDLLSPEWIRALSTLQDRVPALPFDQICPAIEAAIGGPIGEHFATFDPQPLAAASIAQVHAATLLTGEQVIVKVRRPGIERTVDADLRLLRRLARAAERRIPEVVRLKPDELLRYFAESLDREMDLSAEGRASDEIGTFLTPLGIRTARFEWQLTGRRVNVQERLAGIPATDLDAARARGLDLAALARTYAQAVLRMIIFNGQFHADPHPGNVILLDGPTLCFIDFGAVGTLLPRRREELVRLALAIAADDTAGVVDILMVWAGDPPVDRNRLELALSELIDQFKNVVLDQIDLTRIFNQVFALLREFQLSLPPDLALVLRTLLTAEGFVRRVDPSFDIGGELAPIARELVAERTSVTHLRKEARKLFAAFGRAAFSTPDLIGQLEKVARTGKLPISLDVRDVEKLRGSSENRRRPDPHLLPGALAISGAILAEPMPAAAAVILTLGGVLLLLNWRTNK